MTRPTVVSVEEAAAILGVQAAGIRDKIRRGTLSATVSPHGAYRLRLVDVMAYRKWRQAGHYGRVA